MFNKKSNIFFLLLVLVIVIWVVFNGQTEKSEQTSNTSTHELASSSHSPTLEGEQTLKEQSPELSEQPIDAEQLIDSEQLLEDKDTEIASIHQIIDSMTIDEKIGQLFILGFEGKSFEKATDLQHWIERYHIGNFIVFKRNIDSNEQLKTLIANIDDHNEESDVPIWVGIDQEGGVVNRLPNKYPAAQQYVAWSDTALTYSKHTEMALELVELGIDINFGPVLDINSNPNNPVINTRAFGNDIKTVMMHTEAVIESYNKNKLFAVGKHYPGHGDTSEDSHKKLPVINKTWAELLELELQPFIHAIDMQIPSIMVGHLLINSVDDQYPASLSSTLIEDKLINELGYNGIVITDDLVMDGILDHFTIGEAAVLALEAGAHMLIIGHENKLQLDAVNAVKAAVSSGRISELEINEKIYKLLTYKLD